MRFWQHRAVLVFLLVFSSSSALFAQTSRGTISGIVTDPTGAIVSDAEATLRNIETNVPRTTRTNGSGLYRFDAVDPGNYEVSVSGAGFDISKTDTFVVSAGQVASVDIAVKVGNQKVTVEVSAEAARLQTESPVRGGTISNRELTQLPVAGRNSVSLALNLPGVTTNRFSFGTGTFSADGARGRSNNFLIDGTENNDISIAGQAFQITNPDAVEQTIVQTTNFDSEYGRAGGAVVNVITKGGTNSLHGTASYFVDSTFDDAINNIQAQSPVVLQRGRPFPGTEQIWAGTVGGPIRKDQTFFFLAFQEDRRSSSGSLTSTTPSLAGFATLNSLFPQGASPNLDLYRSIVGASPATGQFFPVALGSGRPNVQFGTATISYPNKYGDRQYLIRVDHRFSNADLLSVRYGNDGTNIPVSSSGFFGFNTSQNNIYRNAIVSETHVFSPIFTNELRLAYNRIELNFPVDASNPLAQTLPNYTVNGQSITGLGIPTNLPQGRIANNYTIQDTVTYTVGTHSFRMGTDLLDQRSRQFAPIVQRGALTYNADNTYTAFANFVDDFSGSGGSVQRDFGSPAYYPKLFRQQYFALDRWRVNESLTLSLGLRYEYFGLPVNSLRTPAFTGLFNVDPVTLAGPYNLPNKVKGDKNNFSPSVGVAWNPHSSDDFARALLGENKTVIRTGFSMGYDSFFNNIASNAATSSPNLSSNVTTASVSSMNPRGTPNFSQTLPLTPLPISARNSQNLVYGNLLNPYYLKYSFGIQRELPGGFVLDVSYVGTRGLKLFYTEDLNPNVPAALQYTYRGLRLPYNTGRLDPLQGARSIRTNGSSSTYNSFQSQLSRRFARGLAGQLSYTRSRFIDYGSDIFATGGVTNVAVAEVPTILGGLPREKSLSYYDRANRFVAQFDYQIPFFKNVNPVFRQVLGGWELSGIYTYESGAPYTVLNGLDSDGLDSAVSDRPNLNPSGQVGVRAVPSAGSRTGYVNPDAGGAPINPADAQFIVLRANSGVSGNLARTTQRTPPIDNFDATVFKNFLFRDRYGVELRAEVYNVLNHPQFGNFSASPFDTTLGSINSNANTAPAGRFLSTNFIDGGGRVLKYQIKLRF